MRIMQRSTHMPGFQSFFNFLASFCIVKLATSSIRVKIHELIPEKMQNYEDYADELEQLSYCLFDSLWCYLVDIHVFIPQKMQNDEDYAAFVLFVWFTMMLPCWYSWIYSAEDAEWRGLCSFCIVCFIHYDATILIFMNLFRRRCRMMRTMRTSWSSFRIVCLVHYDATLLIFMNLFQRRCRMMRIMQRSTHMPGFQSLFSFFASFCIVKLATSSCRRVKIHELIPEKMQNDEDYADELEQLLYCLFDSLWCYRTNIYEFIPEKMQNDEDYAEELDQLQGNLQQVQNKVLNQWTGEELDR